MSTLPVILRSTRGIDVNVTADTSTLTDVTATIQQLRERSYTREADVLSEVLEKCIRPKNFGGLNLDERAELSDSERKEVLFLCEAWLESLNAVDKQSSQAALLHSRPKGRRGMTLTEKLFAMHDVRSTGSVKPGQVIRVAVDWIMASELSWGGIFHRPNFNASGGR